MKSLISVAAIAAIAGAASADVLTNVAPVYDFKTETTAQQLPGSTARAGETRTISFDNDSWDLVGDADNVVMLIDMAALFGLASGSSIDLNGIGWDVTIASAGASWQSEARIYFDNDTQDSGEGIFLAPGIGVDSPGTGSYSSGGILKLVDAGLPDLILDNGILRLEWFESFDDIADTVDARMFGTLTLQSSVPAPSGVALLGLGGLVAMRRRR